MWDSRTRTSIRTTANTIFRPFEGRLTGFTCRALIFLVPWLRLETHGPRGSASCRVGMRGRASKTLHSQAESGYESDIEFAIYATGFTCPALSAPHISHMGLIAA